jgi:pectate lyase
MIWQRTLLKWFVNYDLNAEIGASRITTRQTHIWVFHVDLETNERAREEIDDFIVVAAAACLATIRNNMEHDSIMEAKWHILMWLEKLRCLLKNYERRLS